MDLDALHQELVSSPDLLIVQDLDGVCMPLVRDPLTRRLPADYVKAASSLRGSFSVLTNGEHEGRRTGKGDPTRATAQVEELRQRRHGRGPRRERGASLRR